MPTIMLMLALLGGLMLIGGIGVGIAFYLGWFDRSKREGMDHAAHPLPVPAPPVEAGPEPDDFSVKPSAPKALDPYAPTHHKIHS
ncbi:MAG TPA: hypothetical protein VL860_12285 [Planctomycetota bacterium]|nr:hypothetical protein [Planctomycetota bacterium]